VVFKVEIDFHYIKGILHIHKILVKKKRIILFANKKWDKKWKIEFSAVNIFLQLHKLTILSRFNDSREFASNPSPKEEITNFTGSIFSEEAKYII
jgi:hypothetical protein